MTVSKSSFYVAVVRASSSLFPLFSAPEGGSILLLNFFFQKYIFLIFIILNRLKILINFQGASSPLLLFSIPSTGDSLEWSHPSSCPIVIWEVTNTNKSSYR